jgi:hypothetical protein
MFEPGDLVLPAKGESTEDFHFLLPSGFGALPPGKYSVRVYYPFGDALYASNRVSFEVR